jgi:cytochrome c oxidase cbb3-type subunit III
LRGRWAQGVGIVVAAVACVWTGLQVRDIQAVKSRFLIADPDGIARDAAMMRYALPRGRAAFEAHCASCHGSDLRGDPSRGVPNLADADWLYGSGRVGEIERIILYGIRSGHSRAENLADMPAFASANPYARYKIEPLSPREVDDVTTLLYSFQHPDSADARAVARGAEVYHGKGLCFDCHADHAGGDPAIGAPNLTDGIWLYGDGSRHSIKAAISRGLAGVCPQWASRLSPETIRAVAVYVHSRRDLP